MTHRGPRGDSWNKVSVGERIGRMLRIYQSHKGLSLFSEDSLERLGVRGSTSAAHSQRAQKKNDKHTYLYFTHTPQGRDASGRGDDKATKAKCLRLRNLGKRRWKLPARSPRLVCKSRIKSKGKECKISVLMGPLLCPKASPRPQASLRSPNSYCR